LKAREARFARPVLILFLLACFMPANLYANDAGIPEGGYSKPYKFSTNWFLDRIPLWTKLLKDFKGKPDTNYLEVGTLEGRSALWLLENILTHPTSKLTLIDTFTENNYDTLISNIKLSGQADRIKILAGYSTDKLKELPPASMDLVYIDGSGKGTVMLSDLTSTWHLLKLNGIVTISRYQLNDQLRKALDLQLGDPGPQETIDTFMKFYKPYIKVLAYEPNQVVFQKIRQ
jgi:Methyltransferase domain